MDVIKSILSDRLNSILADTLKTIVPVGVLGLGVWAIIKNWDKINPFNKSKPYDNSSNYDALSKLTNQDAGAGDTIYNSTYSYGGASYYRNDDGSAVYTGSDGEKMVFGGTDVNPTPQKETLIDTSNAKVIGTTSQNYPIYETVIKPAVVNANTPSLNQKSGSSSSKITVSSVARDSDGYSAMDRSISTRLSAQGKSDSYIKTYLGIN